MDIGPLRRVIEVEPTTVPVPEPFDPASIPAPAEPAPPEADPAPVEREPGEREPSR